MKLTNPVSYTLNVCRKYGRSSRTNKKHIIFVVLASAVFRFAQIFLPFRWSSQWLGVHKGKIEVCALVTPEQAYRAHKTGRFIENVCNQTPWQAKCLIQAFILRLYLDQYQIPYVLHLGLAKGEKDSIKPMLGHAWITVSRYTVVGGEGHRAFTVIGTYVSRSIADAITP